LERLKEESEKQLAVDRQIVKGLQAHARAKQVPSREI
jgi:hypothetical protein